MLIYEASYSAAHYLEQDHDTMLPQEASLLLYPQPEERKKSQLKNKSCGYKLNYLQDREKGEVVNDDAVGEPEIGCQLQTALLEASRSNFITSMGHTLFL